MPQALIVGDVGIVGTNMRKLLADMPGWSSIGVSRRALPDDPHHIAADLTDREAALAMAPRLGAVTHLFVCARVPGKTPSDEARVNRLLVEHSLDALEAARAPLQRVVLVHGTKWYGSHLGPYRVPAKEDHPRHMPPNFYHDQQDVAEARGKAGGWSWCALRPHTVWGFSTGTGNNLIVLLAVYAALSKQLGLPLRFPGPAATWSKFSQSTHVDLLNRSMLWAATAPEAANQAFNVTNGDLFRWCDVWPRIADFFDMPVGPVQSMSLATMMADKGPLWDAVVAQHKLQPYSMDDLAGWAYGDGLMSNTWDDVSSTVKIRQAGFAEAMDSEDILLQSLAEMRRNRIIP